MIVSVFCLCNDFLKTKIIWILLPRTIYEKVSSCILYSLWEINEICELNLMMKDLKGQFGCTLYKKHTFSKCYNFELEVSVSALQKLSEFLGRWAHEQDLNEELKNKKLLYFFYILIIWTCGNVIWIILLVIMFFI